MLLDDILFQQLKNNFLLTEEEKQIILENQYIKRAEDTTIKSAKHFNNKYILNSINPFNSVMYCNFLYWASHFAYLDKHNNIADKVYYLNKMLNAIDLFYAIELPEIWLCEHPLGAVMGRASYGNGFFFYQGCTVGGNRHHGVLKYPVIGNNVKMYSNSKILGDSHIGNNVEIAANAYLINETVPNNSIVFGQSHNNLVIKKK